MSTQPIDSDTEETSGEHSSTGSAYAELLATSSFEGLVEKRWKSYTENINRSTGASPSSATSKDGHRRHQGDCVLEFSVSPQLTPPDSDAANPVCGERLRVPLVGVAYDAFVPVGTRPLTSSRQ